MNLYKVMLNTIVEPLTHYDLSTIEVYAQTRLRESDEEGRAIVEVVEQAIQYVHAYNVQHYGM